MQDPVREITGVVKSLVECKDATEQQVALKKYFTQNASFDHPLCAVSSRNGVSIIRRGRPELRTDLNSVERSWPSASISMASMHL